MAKYSEQDRRTLIGWFPSLQDDSNFEITSDCTPAYNCIGWTHAAKVIGENILHSKIGTAWDIHHSGGDLFAGSEYGSIFAYMKRPISERYLTDVRKPRIGKIIIK